MSSFFEYRKTTYFDVSCLNFSIETKIKTLFLILYFSLSKKRNGTLGTQIMNHKNGSIYLSQKLLCCIIFSSIFCEPLFEAFILFCFDNVQWVFLNIWKKVFDQFLINFKIYDSCELHLFFFKTA